MASAEDFRRQLVLQLFLQRGEFWERVSAIRREWRIKAETSVPPIKPPPPGTFWDLPRPNGLFIIHPAIDDSLTAAERERLSKGDPMRETTRWIETLKALHDQIVPKQHRTRNYMAARHPLHQAQQYPQGSRERWEYQADVWVLFLGNCVMYDPPDSKLEDFAEAANGNIAAKTRLEPIVWRADAVATAENEAALRQRLLDYFHDLYGGFIAANGLEAAFQQYQRERDSTEFTAITQEYRDRREQIEPEPYISVEDDPDDATILDAAKTLRRMRGAARRRGRAERDQLRCVQCAILRDRYGWTEVRIAHHFGWRISDGNYEGQSRSIVARGYVAEGRKILGRAW